MSELTNGYLATAMDQSGAEAGEEQATKATLAGGAGGKTAAGKDESDEAAPGTTSKARELHRTASIFLRNLAPTITKLEVEAVRPFSLFPL